MLVKLDESLSESLQQVARSYGYDVRTVLGQGWGGMKDDALWPPLVAEDAFLIASDRGFGDIRKFVPGSHAGILILQPGTQSLVAYRALLEEVLSQHELATLIGAVAVAGPSGLRARKAPRKD